MADYYNPTDVVTTGTNGDDTFTVADRGISHTRSLDAGDGYDRLIVDRSFDTASSIVINQFSGDPYVFGTVYPAGPFDDGVLYFQHFESVKFTGTAGNDSASIKVDQAGTVVAINLDGAGGTDSLTLDASGFTSALTFLANTPTITSSFGTFASFEIFTIYGGAGNDEIRTGNGNDSLRGGGGTNILSAGGGNDTIYTVSTTDWTDGGAGYDYWTGNYSDATTALTLDIGDIVKVNGATVAINVEYFEVGSGSGNDVINLTTGNQAMIYGGAGTDLLNFLPATNQVESVLLNGRADGIWVGGINSTGLIDIERVNITGGALNDNFRVLGAFTPGQLTLNGGGGTDLLTGQFDYFTTPTTFIVHADGTVDSNRGQFSNFEQYIIGGGTAADTIVTGAGNDSLSGGDGNDVLAGGHGSDAIYGGDGNDILFSQDHDPNAFTFINYRGISTDFGTEVDTLGGGNGDDYIVAGYGDNVDGGAQGTYGNRLYVSFQGATSGVNADFRLLRTQSSITIGGGVITNIQTVGYLEGSQYDDLLVPIDTGYPTGANVYGRGGNDHIIADYYSGWGNSGLYGGDGDDLIDATDAGYGPNLYGDAGNDTLIGGRSSENMHGGTGDDIINGNYGFDYLWGDEGNDTIDGGSFPDNLFGGDGNDVLYGAGDADIIRGDDGDDTIYGDFSLISSVNAVGPLSNDDILYGDAGNDRIDGGIGNDTMSGGTGDDTFVVDSLGDVIVENAGEGNDTIETALSYSLAGLANVENLTLTGTAAVDGTGNALANVLTGNAAANMLIGGGGADTLIGGLGDDYYVVTDSSTVIVELAGEGNDTIRSSVSYVLGAGVSVEQVRLMGTASVDLTGNADFQTLAGNNGNNVLDSGGGGDRMKGAGGDDTYIVRSAADSIVEVAGDGNDTAKAALSYTLGAAAQVEHLVTLDASATTAINLTGNAYSHDIQGNAGINVLTGGTGNDVIAGNGGTDTLIGGLGDDLYVITDASTVVVENAGEGSDTIKSSVSYVLGAGVEVETLRLMGTANLDLTGNAGSQSLGGNSGNNVIDGGGGGDNMKGGAGNDTYIVRSAGDHIVEVAGDGDDTVRAALNFTLGGSAQVEHLATLDATTAINLTGNAYSHDIQGNAGINVLTGGSGDDALQGFGGDDTLFGGGGADLFVFGHGTGQDVVGDFASGVDRLDLSAFGFASFQDVLTATHDVGGNAVIDLGSGDTVTLTGVTTDHLHSGDFVL